MTVLHVASLNPITKEFFPFLQKNVDCRGHQLLLMSGGEELATEGDLQLILAKNRLAWAWDFLIAANRSDKIALHGLTDWHLFPLLLLNPWLLRRCHWFIWGGDLYTYRSKVRGWKWRVAEKFRKIIIKRIGYLVTYVEGDVELAREWYGAKGKYKECNMYTSNVYRDSIEPRRVRDSLCVQVGNSADPGNYHLDIFNRIQSASNGNIIIYVPLAYGSPEYAKLVVNRGKEILGDNFNPITTLMSAADYKIYLDGIDVAIFNHDRQQAMGNIIGLLGRGKKVYMRSDITSWKMFEKLGVKVFDNKDIELSEIDTALSERNRELIIKHFSEKKLISQLKDVFEA